MSAESLAEDFFKKMKVLATTVIDEHRRDFANKQGRELTDQEKFAIAFMSGVKINYKAPELHGDNYMANLTTEKCGVCWDGTKFLIAVMSNGKEYGKL